MPTSKKTFHKGRMNLDADDRLLPPGEYREAYNVDVINSEGSDVGAVEKRLSNKQLTNIDFGANIFEIGKYEDEAEDKLYWFIKSDSACFLMEWDQINEVVSVVLKDSRPSNMTPSEGGRVLNLKETHLITGIQKVISEDSKEDLLLWTDDNIQPCCINIERAKTWGENNFEEDDIFLIKKPPRYAPIATPTYTSDKSNNLEERFLSFSYRYKYLDGMYSAISDYTNYQFYPKPFNLDYFTLDNLGMVNSYNAVKIDFDTGKSQVTDIQLVVKETNSNNLYVVETFNKSKHGWGDNQSKTHIFSKNKIYAVLPEKELYRPCDTVPRLAKALTLIENYPVFGNYLQGYDIEDEDANPINIDYTVNLINTPIEEAAGFTIDNTVTNKLGVTNPDTIPLEVGYNLLVYLRLDIGGLKIYENTFTLILTNTYTTLNSLFVSEQFQILLDVINTDFQANFNAEGLYVVQNGWAVDTQPVISYALETDVPTFTVSPILFDDTLNGNTIETVDIDFAPESLFSLSEQTNSTSCKTNRGFEVGLLYLDNYGRRTTTLTSPTNTLFIPQKYSIFKNSLQIHINNKPPYWADRYKIVVKTNPLQYQTLYINEFYTEGFYTWCKLEAENKDKIKVGDRLIIKRAGDVLVNDPIEVKVLELEAKEKDFIELNQDAEGNDIVERSGMYMKIRPVGFSMDENEFAVDVREFGRAQSWNGFPVGYLDLFTDTDADPDEELLINSGSSITLRFHSNRKYDSGWKDVIFEDTFYTQTAYDNIEDWFDEIIFSRSALKADDGSETFGFDYLPGLDTVRGNISTPLGSEVFTPDVNGKLYLKTTGVLSGGTGHRGFVNAQITVRNSSGVYVFETKPLQADNNIFYETEETFDVVDGYHIANNLSQSISEPTAIVDLDFFNCYTQGNGVESYKIRDGFNTNYLNVDLRPSATSIEPYRAIRRFADLTYGQPFIESTGLNGLNEFNASTANFKELDKQYGSIQALGTRDTDLVVWKEEKTGYVLFGKDLIKTANGQSVISVTPEILGAEGVFMGENGIGIHPESLAKYEQRFYWVNARRGTPMRLSTDGASKINYGLINHFRELYIANPTSKKVGGFNPHNGTYVLASELEDDKTLNAFCGNTIYKTGISEPFTYVLNLNKLIGDIVLQYDIQGGAADIEIAHDGVTNTYFSRSGTGSETMPRNDVNIDTALVTITPLNGAIIDLQLTNVCPIGIAMKLYTIVLVDEGVIGQTVTNRFRWGANTLYADNHVFEAFEISQFLLETGLEGNGKFPTRGSNITLQSFKDTTDSFLFKAENENKLGYLVTASNYGEGDITDILNEATFLTTTETQLSLDSFINQGNFVFNRPSDNHNLYLIHDYRSAEVTINQNTKIKIFFDKSGSMDTTLSPLQVMRDTLLKDRLLPFYNDDSDLYDASVEIIEVDGLTQDANSASAIERTMSWLDMLAETPPEGNVVNLIFQDEAQSVYHGTDILTRTQAYDDDLLALRTRLDTYGSAYYRAVIFQVSGYPVFKDFLQAIENGTGVFIGANGLSDRTEFNYKYDITDGGTSQYYLDQIVTALTELGYNI